MGSIERSEELLEAARGAVSQLHELSPQLMGCAVLAEAGEQALAASGDDGAWSRAARALIEAADAAAPEPATEAHVATEDGEAHMVRSQGLVIVAVAPRTVLSSLLTFDMRAVLRDVAAVAGGESGPGAPETS